MKFMKFPNPHYIISIKKLKILRNGKIEIGT
jgi:hypothetical protein